MKQAQEREIRHKRQWSRSQREGRGAQQLWVTVGSTTGSAAPPSPHPPGHSFLTLRPGFRLKTGLLFQKHCGLRICHEERKTIRVEKPPSAFLPWLSRSKNCWGCKLEIMHEATSNHGISLSSRFHDNVILVGLSLKHEETLGLDSWWNPSFECKLASRCYCTLICLFKLFKIKKGEEPVGTESTHLMSEEVRSQASSDGEWEEQTLLRTASQTPASVREPPWPRNLGCRFRHADREVQNPKTSSKSQHDSGNF